MDIMLWSCLILGEVPGDDTEVALGFTVLDTSGLDAWSQMQRCLRVALWKEGYF